MNRQTASDRFNDSVARRERRSAEPMERASWTWRDILLLATLEATVLAIGLIDYLTGVDVGLSLFYLIPIVVAAWYLGRNESIAVGLTAASCWFAADYLLRVDLWLSLWNGLTRLVIYISQGWLISRLHRDRSVEARLARTDHVTKLPNSRGFLEKLETSLADGERPAVAFVDLDNFKRVNDLFGHSAGDDVLREVAQSLCAASRSADTPARVGGDEFALILPRVDLETAREIADRVIDSARRLALRYPEAGVGASVGIALSDRSHVTSDELIRVADAAMYEAKEEGKGKGAVVIRSI